MELRWVSLDEAHEAVLLGRVSNSITVVAVLTAVAKRNAGWLHLRAGDAPWPQLEWRNATA
jgi:ADP-ribose pyrophosphatase